MYKRILILVNDTAAPQPAVKEGVALAQVDGAAVVFFYLLARYVAPVADVPEMMVLSPAQFRREVSAKGERLLAAATVIADKAGVASSQAMAQADDDASQCIADAARTRRCGLIVAASERRNAVMRLLTGSVIPGLITRSTVPVLVCRSAGRPRRADDAAVAQKTTAKPRATRTA